MDMDMVKYILKVAPELVPNIKDLPSRILKDISVNGFYLNMLRWHTCETTHCLAGFCEIYAEEKGKFLVKHFGHWMCGALIFYKSTGHIPDFYASDEDAISELESLVN
jgi:hypothetical protein